MTDIILLGSSAVTGLIQTSVITDLIFITMFEALKKKDYNFSLHDFHPLCFLFIKSTFQFMWLMNKVWAKAPQNATQAAAYSTYKAFYWQIHCLEVSLDNVRWQLSMHFVWVLSFWLFSVLKNKSSFLVTVQSVKTHLKRFSWTCMIIELKCMKIQDFIEH